MSGSVSRTLTVLGAIVACVFAKDVAGQAAIVPVPDAIQAAYAVGTRDVRGRPGPAYWQIRPHYDLAGRLYPATATFEGTGTIRLLNTTPSPLGEFVLRLDQNRFRAERSRTAVTAGMTLRRMTVNGVDVALDGPRVIGLTSTVVQVVLTRPIAVGDSVRIEVAWDYEIPSGDEHSALRQGRWGDSVFQMAQWYPRLAMYDDLEGWDVAEHDGSMEFYNPFGSFQVALEVPSGWLIGATGALENQTEVLAPRTLRRLSASVASDTAVFVVGPTELGEGTSAPRSGYNKWRFRADSVSDFAWAASKEYSWAVLASARVGSKRIPIHVFATSRHEERLLSSMAEVAEAITSLSERFTPYPWPHHTLVDGPEGAMEYPALTMSHGGAQPHETAHQWFPMIVGTDETRFNFLDEGFAGFLPAVIHEEQLGDLRNEREAMAPILLANDVRTVRIVNGYGRGARMLRALAAEFGDRQLLRALGSYAADWRFKHPSPWDFMASMEHALEADLDSFWLEWLFSAAAIER